SREGDDEQWGFGRKVVLYVLGIQGNEVKEKMDRIICDLNKTPDLFQEPPQNCPKCGNPVDGQYCQGYALLRKKFKEDMFTYCIENGIFQDFKNTSEPSNDNTNVVNALQEPFVVKQDPMYINTPSWDHPTIFYNDNDDKDCTIAITPILSTEEPDNSLSMGDEHLDTILAMESDEFVKSSVENLIDSLLDEFAGELTLLNSIPPRINETDCDPEEETRLIKKFLYDNSSPRLSEEFISENSDAAIKSFSSFPILVEDSYSFMEEIYLSFTSDDPMPSSIEEDDYDSERDILILEELLSKDSLSLPEK
nr:hypothetical protein [Tanacetum cinerariifolium]